MRCWTRRCQASAIFPNGPGVPVSAAAGSATWGSARAAAFLPVPPAPGEPRRLPTWWFGYYDHVLRRDRATGRWLFEALWTPGRAEALERRFEELAAAAACGRGRAAYYSCGSFAMIPSAAEHRSAVRRAVSYIRSGDIFQANICLRLEADFAGRPARRVLPCGHPADPPYAAFIADTGRRGGELVARAVPAPDRHERAVAADQGHRSRPAASGRVAAARAA